MRRSASVFGRHAPSATEQYTNNEMEAAEIVVTEATTQLVPVDNVAADEVSTG